MGLYAGSLVGGLANSLVQLLGVDSAIPAVLPGGGTLLNPQVSDGAVSLGGASLAATGGRVLTNFGFPVGLDLVQSAAGAAYGNATARTVINGTMLGPYWNAAGSLTAGRLNLVGRVLRVKARGSIANTSTPNLTMDIALGSTVIATTAVTATAAITGTLPWLLEVDILCTTAGASGVLLALGHFDYFTTAPVQVTWKVANPTPFTGVTIDLTASYALNIGATWGTQSVSNTLTMYTLTAEILY